MQDDAQNGFATQAAVEDQGTYTAEERNLIKLAGEACIDAMADVLGERSDLSHIVSASLIGVFAFASSNPDTILREAFVVAYNSGKGNYFSEEDKARFRAEFKEAERERDAGENMNNLCNSVDEGEKNV